MAFCGKHYLSWVLMLSCPGFVLSFVKVECDETTVGQFTHQSLLNCVVKPTQEIADIEIVLVTWKKDGDETLLLDYKKNERFNHTPGYRFAAPSWDYNNMNISLLITNTKVTDEGNYSFVVITNRGIKTGYASLKVTAKYSKPNITDDKENKALICRTSGGYPEGKLLWFDNYKANWTPSSKLEVKQMDNGLLELSSTLTLMPGSTFPEYTCVVLNSSGSNESETSHLMNQQKPIAQKDAAQTPNIVAGVVVIGSLIVGMLLVLLIRRRRSHPQLKIPTDEPDDGDDHYPPDSKA